MKYLLSLIVLASTAFTAYAADVSLYVSPASSVKILGDTFILSVGLSSSSDKVYAVEGKLLLDNLNCGSISLSEGVTAQSAPSCSNPYFLIGIPAGTTTGKTLFNVSVVPEKVGSASSSFTGVDIIGKGVSLGGSGIGGKYMINPVLAASVATTTASSSKSAVETTLVPLPKKPAVKPIIKTEKPLLKASTASLAVEISTTSSEVAAAISALPREKSAERSRIWIYISIVVAILAIYGAYASRLRKG